MASKELSNEVLVNMYRDMIRIRQFESTVGEVFAEGEIPGFVHLGIGQEGVQVGIAYATRPGDTINSTHREHGLILIKGRKPRKVMAELYGKVTGYCKGKGGSMHVMDCEAGTLGCNGILGPGMTLATGLAYAHKFHGKGNVAIGMFGDGQSNRGEFHEALNFGSIWKLPIVYVCVNNGYAISLSYDQQQNI